MKYMLCIIMTVSVFSVMALSTAASAASDGPCQGMIMMTVSGAEARIAGVAHATGAVSGLRWYNNDDAIRFPMVEIYEAADEEHWAPGSLLATLYSVQGSCDDWTEITLPGSVTSRTGLYCVVFHLPTDSQYTARGHGGGAAIGYASSGGAVRGFVSLDGEDWIGVCADVGVSVVAAEDETVKSLAKSKSDAEPAIGAIQVRVVRNPVTDGTAIAYRLSGSGFVALTLYDARGRIVRRLVNGTAPQGDFAVYWDGRDDAGRRAPSGTYVARLQSCHEVTNARLVLLH